MRRQLFKGIFIHFTLCACLLAQNNKGNVQHCFVTAKDLTDQYAPKFEAYPSATHPLTTPAQLDLRSNPIAKRYRTVINQEMRHGANFAYY